MGKMVEWIAVHVTSRGAEDGESACRRVKSERTRPPRHRRDLSRLWRVVLAGSDTESRTTAVLVSIRVQNMKV